MFRPIVPIVILLEDELAYKEKVMDIILEGCYSQAEAIEAIRGVFTLFSERYQVTGCREMHLVLTLVNPHGEDVELVDSNTGEVYRIFEIHRTDTALRTGRRAFPGLRLVIDNTRR